MRCLSALTVVFSLCWSSVAPQAAAAARVVRIGAGGQPLNTPIRVNGASAGTLSRGNSSGSVISLKGTLAGARGAAFVRTSARAAPVQSANIPGTVFLAGARSATSALQSQPQRRDETESAGTSAALDARASGISADITVSVRVQRALKGIKRLAALQIQGRTARMSPGAAWSAASAMFDAQNRARNPTPVNSASDEWKELGDLDAAVPQAAPGTDPVLLPAKKERLHRRVARAISKPAAFLAKGSARIIARSSVGGILSAKIAERWGRPPEVKTRFSDDDYGGPQKLELKLPVKTGTYLNGLNRLAHAWRQQAVYGVKWAINMLGIMALMSLALKPLAAAMSWQLGLSEGLLRLTGRVELLTDIGPAAIAEAVAERPYEFLFRVVPLSAGYEELIFRVAAFWLPFLALALGRSLWRNRSLWRKLSAWLETLPAPGVISVPFRVLSSMADYDYDYLVGRRIFKLAAIMSAMSFALAHLGAWGFSPYTFVAHMTMGMVLAWLTYRTRGIVAPFFAHLFYNLGMISVAFILPLYLPAAWAAGAGTLAGVFAAAVLWYNYRSYRRDKAAAIAAARGEPPPQRSWWRRALAVTLVIPLLYAAFTVFAFNPAPDKVPAAAQTAPVADSTAPGLSHDHAAVPGKGFEQLLGGEAAQFGAPAKELSTVEIIARAKQAAVMVRTGGGMGSGFIITADGLLVTNAHVVSRGVSSLFGEQRISGDHHETVMIRLSNGMEVPGTVVGFNRNKDIALVRLPPNMLGWPSVDIGNSAELREGEDVVVIGHPRGLPRSSSKGIVSGLGNRSNGAVDYIQVDAAANPGNSGGALFNTKGQVVGIVSMIMPQSDGITFAITSADLQVALGQYRKVGNIDSPWMGAIFYPGDPEAPGYGATVEAVRPGSPAYAAGLRSHDVILTVDGHKLANESDISTSQLHSYLHGKIPGDKIALTVSRDGGVLNLELTLGGR